MLLTDTPLTDGTSARIALRHASDASHQRMHGLEPFAQIAAGVLPIGEYRLLLQSLYRFHSSVGEAAYQSGLSTVSSASGRLELLRSDIEVLGGKVPFPVSGWEAGAGEAVLGALYVAEGSMLGGRVIARQLNWLFGSQREGRSFFIGNECDRASWSRLLAVIEVRCVDATTLNAAIDGACRTFGWFELCITAHKEQLEPFSRTDSYASDHAVSGWSLGQW